jgi:hypothetical protein
MHHATPNNGAVAHAPVVDDDDEMYSQVAIFRLSMLSGANLKNIRFFPVYF